MRVIHPGHLKPPRLRTNAEEPHRKATWLELFYDLVFVGAIAQLASRYVDGFSLNSVPGFLMLLIPVWWAWVGQTFYLTRFDSDDISQRLFTLAQMVPVASMAAFIPTGLEQGSTGFALSYVAVRAILVIQYIRAVRRVPETKALINRYIFGFGGGATLWLISAFVPQDIRPILWFLGMIVDFVAPITAGQLHAKFPPHLTHIPERFGLFTIIVLGEGIIAIVAGFTKTSVSPTALLGGFFGILIMFCLWWDYFESAKAAEGRRLDKNGGVKKFQTWLYLHLPLVATVVSTAMMIKMGIVKSWSVGFTLETALLLSWSVAWATFVIAQIQLTSPVFECTQKARHEIRTRLFLSLVTALLGFAGPYMKPVAFLGVIAAVMIGQILISVWQAPDDVPAA